MPEKLQKKFAYSNYFLYLCSRNGKRRICMHISQSSYRKLYTIDRTIRTIMRVCTVIWFVTIIAVVIPTPYKQQFAYACLITLGFICLLALTRLCFSWFVKSDEEEEMEEKVEYVIKKHHAHLLQAAKDNYSPLCTLTPEQEERVMQLLRDLPSNPKDSDYINLAQVTNHMKALEQLDKARLGDVYALQSWVERVTGKRTPEYRQFNEAIQKARDSQVAKARKTIERILQ